MSYRSYVKMIKSVFVLFGLISVITLLMPSAHFVSIMDYFANRIFVIFILLFAIYAQIKGVKDTRPLEKPIVFILLGALFVLPTFGFPIYFYFKTPDIYQDNYRISQFNEIEEQATNINQSWAWRDHLARKFYLDTGEKISFLDKDNNKIIYSPDDKTMKLRGQWKESKKSFDLARQNARITAFILLGILVLSFVIFLSVLRYSSKANISSRHD